MRFIQIVEAGKLEKIETKGQEGSEIKASPALTPIPISRRTRNILIFAAAALLLFICWMVPDALVMAIGGATLAIVLSFPVRLFGRVMPRGLAILSSFLLVIGLIALAVASIIPVIVDQLSSLIGAVPGVVMQAGDSVNDVLAPLKERGILSGSSDNLLDNVGQDLINAVQGVAQQILGGTIGFLSGTVGAAITLFGVIFISAYLLIDVRRIKAACLLASPRSYRRDARELWNSFGFSLSRYLAGLALSMSVQGALSAAALFLIGVPYALLLGLWVALTAILPYIGAWLGAIPAVLIALSVSPTTAILTAVLFLAIQQLEGNFLTPRIQSQALGVHPIIVFLAVVIGAGMFGLFGAIFAVPALAVVGVLFTFFRARLTTDHE
ncbi:MAG: AI-2E family transporter [Actinomycetota bacterium]|nr:AI-2E family transporter [Rubrobacter sp.]MDQ3506633.1 AI-2E family transporter [Actinomycetota bacterium]